jgi:hypothetical protein
VPVFQVNAGYVSQTSQSASSRETAKTDKELNALWVSQMVKLNERWENSYSQNHPLESAMKVHLGSQRSVSKFFL